MSRKYQFEHEMAPHVEPKWAATFTMELNIRQAAGEEIGAALAEVDSHCAESGETAQQAFGDPAEYAAQLDLPSQSTPAQDRMWAVWPQMGQAAGMLAMLWAIGPFGRGEDVTLHAGELGLLALVMVSIAVIAWQAQLVVRMVARRPLLAVLCCAVPVAAMIASAALLRHPVVTLPAGWLVGVGVVVLLLATVWAVLCVRRLNTSEGMIISPLEDESATHRRANSVRKAGYVPALMMPVFATLLALVMLTFA